MTPSTTFRTRLILAPLPILLFLWLATAAPVFAQTGPLVDPNETQKLVDSVNEVLRFITGVSVIIAAFSVVWAGFVLMSEGASEHDQGNARAVVVSVAVGLVIVFSTTGITQMATEILEVMADPNIQVPIAP